MKKFFSILTILGILCSCDMADGSNENNQVSENVPQISQDKLEICPTANKTAWVIDYAQEMFAQVGLGDKRIEEMDSVYRDAVLLKIYKEINNRTEEFELVRLEKYSDISCDITIDGIKKGDVILSKTHGAMLMAVDYETSFHHASLCIKTQTNH